MSVDLDWRYRRDTFDQPPAGSPKGRRRRWRKWVTLLAAVVVLVALGAFSYWRARRAWLEQTAADVRAVAQLEMRALADGDVELYLSLQDGADAVWLEAQRAHWLSGCPLLPPAPGFTVTLPATIELPIVIGDRARVEVVRLAGPPGEEPHPFRSVAFYRQVADGRWVHTAPDPDYGGRVLVWVGPRNDLAGYIVQTELLAQLAMELETTTATFCGLFPCPDGLRFTLAFTDTLGEQRAAIAVLPAPHLAGVPDNEGARAIWVQAIKGHLANLMLDEVVGRLVGGFIEASLRHRVKEYLRAGPSHQLDPVLLAQAVAEGRLLGLVALWEQAVADDQTALAEDEAALLVRFVEQAYGPEGVASLLAQIGTASSLEALLRDALGADLASFEKRWLDYVHQEVAP